MWFWISVTAGLASAIDKVLNSYALKNKGNVIVYTFYYMLIISIVSFIASLPFNIIISPNLIIILSVQTAIWSLGTLFAFLSQSKTDVSLVMIISRSRVIWLIPLGFIFLNERLSVISIVGIIVIFIGLAVLFFKERIHKDRGIHLMFISSILVAIGVIFNTILVRNYLQPIQVTFFTMFGQVVVFLLIMFYRGNVKERSVEILKRAKFIILFAAIIETYAITGINIAYKIGSTSASTAVYLGMTITTIWMGIIFLRERTNIVRKIISSAIVTVGIIIVKVFS